HAERAREAFRGALVLLERGELRAGLLERRVVEAQQLREPALLLARCRALGRDARRERRALALEVGEARLELAPLALAIGVEAGRLVRPHAQVVARGLAREHAPAELVEAAQLGQPLELLLEPRRAALRGEELEAPQLELGGQLRRQLRVRVGALLRGGEPPLG